MRKAKQFLKDYLGFGKRDRIGVIALLGLMAAVYSFPYAFSKRNGSAEAKPGSFLVKAMDTLISREKENRDDFEENANEYVFQPTETKSFAKGALFQFDPNTLSTQGWQQLGLSEKTSKTIDKYRSKGGKFYKPEDIKKIWGMPEGFYERVKGYIVITSSPTFYSPDQQEKTYSKAEKKLTIVHINEADSTAFIALPGIGSKLAARIINFRDKLGGFYSVEQIKDTYGLPDSTFQKIRGLLQLSGSVKKFNINRATKDKLKAHPYIKWNLAKAIVEYRNQHGAFKSLNELKKIVLIDEGTFEKIVPYLSL